MALEKETFTVDEPCTLSCPDKSHPLFTVKISVDKPVAVCYYCSKVWVLNNGNSRT